MKRSETMDKSFPEEIFIEILLRLPVKSLMRFKCVAKWWRSLISDPGFAKSHLQRLKAGDIIPSQKIFKTSPLETIDYEALEGGTGGNDDRAVVKAYELKMAYPHWYPYLVGSCDGLVCLSVSGRLLIDNPTTKESRDLPDSDLLRQDKLFDGFGYDSRSDDYKIVQGGGSRKLQVAIFSLRSGFWKRLQVQQKSHLIVFGRGVYWNDALHWRVIDWSRKESGYVIISFDLSKEKFHQVLSVPEVHGGIDFEGLGIHGANLLIYGSSNSYFEAWITNEYRRGGSWTKLFSVLTDCIPSSKYGMIPIAYTRSGKIVFLIDSDNMIVFNPKDNTYKDYPIRSVESVGSAIGSTIYLESLVSPYLDREP